MKKNKYSVIIVGSGISGLYTALKTQQLVKTSDGILLITKHELKDSNSYYAQGGMVAVLKENPNDNIELHLADTVNAGAGLTEIENAKFISKNSDKIVKDLVNFGVKFDKEENGKYALTKEAAHSVNRILHCMGDATGREIELALCNAVKNNKNITILEDTMVIELLKNNAGKCIGVTALNKDFEQIYSDVVILATGGIGQLYKYTTNPTGATGDGLALAYNIGAELRDMEFVQFHPTALAIDNKENKNRFLISEAVRGEGAKLCNKDGFEYMKNYHEKCELAPRDVVARANFSQMQKNNTQNVWLNATKIEKGKLLKRFPTISKKCLENGIDISKDYIPVAPAAHYFMGGIKTDMDGKTSVDGLYAVGEVASTGLHGANRLASNSILECVVCAWAIAKHLSTTNFSKNNSEKFEHIIPKQKSNLKKNINDYKAELKEIMWENAGIIRNESSLKSALNKIENLKTDFRKNLVYNKEEYEFINMLTVAKIIVESAINRKESRGAHFRTDFPNPSKICEHSITKRRK